MSNNFKIIKADPGYYAVDRICWKSKDKIEAIKVPVIAWRIILDEDEADLLPICADGLSDLWRGEILAPDGVVYQRCCQHWSSLEEFQASLNEKKHPLANHVETTILDRLCGAASNE